MGCRDILTIGKTNIFLWSCLCTICAADLKSMRDAVRNATAEHYRSERDPLFHLYHLFREPLPLVHGTFLPLCGNGVIDTRQSYTEWYANNPGKDYNWMNLSMVKFIVDEVCDDGNRMDGDGCSADCLDMDVFTEPCILKMNLDRDESLSGIFMDDTTGNLYAFTNSKRAGLLKTETLRGIEFEWAFYFESNVMDVVFLGGFLHVLTQDASWYKISKESGVSKVKSLVLSDSESSSTISSFRLKFVLHDKQSLQNVYGSILAIAGTESVLSIFSQKNETYIASTYPQQNSLVPRSAFRSDYTVNFDDLTSLVTLNNLFEESKVITFSLNHKNITISDTFISIDTTSVWSTILLTILNSVLYRTKYIDQFSLQYSANESIMEQYKDEIFQNNLRNTDLVLPGKLVSGRMKQSVASHFGLLEQRSSLRSLFQNNTLKRPMSWIYHTGHPTFFRSLLAMLDQSSDTNFRSNEMARAVDTEIDYDFLEPIRRVNQSMGKYMDVFNSFMDDVSVFSEQGQSNESKNRQMGFYLNRVVDTLKRKGKHNSISHFEQDPWKQDWYLLRSGKLYLIRKSAVIVKDRGGDGTCVAVNIMPCPRCSFFNGRTCSPCGLSSQQHSSLSSRIQCDYSSCVKNGRRLLSNSSVSGIDGTLSGVNVSTTVKDVSLAEIERRFGALNFTHMKFITISSLNVIQVVIVDVQDPLFVLREMKFVLSSHSDWTVVTAPAAHYSFDAAEQGSSEVASGSNVEPWVLYTAIFGTVGLILVIVLIFVFYKSCHRKPHRHSHVNSTTKFHFNAYYEPVRF